MTKRGVMRGGSWSMIEWRGIQIFLDHYSTGYEGDGYLTIGPFSVRLFFYVPIRSFTIQIGWSPR